MGASTFITTAWGDTPKEAFNNALVDARAEYGTQGYTGTIAEKTDFVVITLPEGENAEDYAERLLDNEDQRVRSKWGPAGCIHVKDREYYFFGWSPE